jgi:hypothetical protein
VKEVHAKLLKDIDDTHACLDRLKPDVVILRSTVSSQTHFVVLAQVAKNRGVPSIEMQHGLEYYGPGSVSLRHRAKYTGVYGPLTKRQYESLEDKSTTPVIIGSPRFDVYASVRERVEKKLKPEPLSILCVAPAVDPGGDSPDTYDTEDYYKAVAASVRDIPNVSVTIKFRPGPNRDVFVKKVLEEAFKDISYTIAQFERFDELYPKHDIVISCYSTALIEALQCGKPVIYLGLSNVQSMMGRHHFAEYEAAHAMQIATTVSELTDVIRLLTKKHEREILSDGARAFLKSEYLFDGHSRERAVAFIMKLVEEREKRV